MRDTTHMQMPVEADWEWRSVTHISDFVSRGTAPTYVEKSTIHAIGQRCVTRSGFAARHSRPHDERRMQRILLAERGDVLVNSTGTGTIGRSCIFDHAGSFVVDSHVSVIRPKSEMAEPRWVESLIRSPWGQRHLENFCYSGSTNQVELTTTRLARTAIPVPPLPEQSRIVEILDSMDESICTTEAMIYKLELVEQGLLSDVIERGIKSDGTLGPAPDLSGPARLMVPAGWEVGSAIDFCQKIAVGVVNSATWAYVKAGVAFLRSQNVRPGRIVLDDMLHVTQSSIDFTQSLRFGLVM